MKTYELKPLYDTRKSFYGKATVTEKDGKIILTSYTTDVCYIDSNGDFIRTWEGESATTMRHINEFIKQNGIAGGGVAWWRQQPCA